MRRPDPANGPRRSGTIRPKTCTFSFPYVLRAYRAMLHLRLGPRKGPCWVHRPPPESHVRIWGKQPSMTDEQETRPECPMALVREATAGDAEALHTLARELADALGDRRPQLEAVRARLLELLEEPRARVLVAETEGVVVGAASLWMKPDLAHGDTVVEVPMLVVSENARRQGVGKLLVEEVQSIGATENAALIELVAARKNDVARAFYRALGFIETDHVALEFIGNVEDPPNPQE